MHNDDLRVRALGCREACDFVEAGMWITAGLFVFPCWRLTRFGTVASASANCARSRVKPEIVSYSRPKISDNRNFIFRAQLRERCVERLKNFRLLQIFSRAENIQIEKQHERERAFARIRFAGKVSEERGLPLSST
jgi:hypothetical protein